MSDHFLKINGTPTIVTCGNGYQYGGFTFEYHRWLGPTKLNKDGEFSKRQGRKFYQVVSQWEKLTKRQREKTRIYG